jgi:hypothetical protein
MVSRLILASALLALVAAPAWASGSVGSAHSSHSGGVGQPKLGAGVAHSRALAAAQPKTSGGGGKVAASPAGSTRLGSEPGDVENYVATHRAWVGGGAGAAVSADNGPQDLRPWRKW